MSKKTPIKVLKDFDDAMHLLTGKRIKDVLPRAIEYFGQEVIEKVMAKTSVQLPSDSPYAILGVRHDAADFIIKAVYRKLAGMYHPDNRETGNEEKFKKMQGAYDAIVKERKNSSTA